MGPVKDLGLVDGTPECGRPPDAGYCVTHEYAPQNFTMLSQNKTKTHI